MRRFALPLAALFTLAACTGDSGGNAVSLPDTTTTELPVQTVATSEAPPATEVVTTEAAPSTTGTSTTTTTEVVPLTVLEPSTTALPVDIDETFVEAFATYQDAWRARQDGARDPSNEEVRDRIQRLFDVPLLPQLLDNLDAQIASNLLNVPVDDREMPRVEFVEGVVSVEDGSVAQFVVCEFSTDRVVDTSTQEIVYDDIVAITGEVRMTKSSDTWRVTDEVSTNVEFGTACTR